MRLTAVESTTLRTVGYDANRELLQLEFQTHAVYHYFQVPFHIYEELLNAASKGTYFNQFIRQKFAYALVKTAASS